MAAWHPARLEKNPDYWGENVGADELVFHWSTESAARLLALQAGTVDGIDNPAPNDFATIEGDANLQLIKREALNTMYVGFNENFEPFDDVRVRQALAMGIDRQRIVDNFYPGGLGPRPTSRRAHRRSAAKETRGTSSTSRAPRPCWPRPAWPTASAHGPELPRRGSWLPARPERRGPGPAGPASRTTSDITVTIEVQESGTFLDNATAGALNGLYLLGWGADYPDPTNFLDYHFNNAGNLQFGDVDPSVTEPLDTGAQTLDTEVRAPLTWRPTTPSRRSCRWSRSPTAPRRPPGWRTSKRAHASPLGNESFAHVTPADNQMVWMQNAEPIALYCADETDGETLRLCEQVTEALYAYEVGGTLHRSRPWPTECVGNEDATEFTCTLRQGVTFHDGAAFDANDVVLSYAVQWDAATRSTSAAPDRSSTSAGLFGSFLNPPPEE